MKFLKFMLVCFVFALPAAIGCSGGADTSGGPDDPVKTTDEEQMDPAVEEGILEDEPVE